MRLTVQKTMLFVILALFSFSVFAQTGVNGFVKNNRTNEEIVGATIAVQGTTNATITDLNGEFTLKTNAGEVELLISYMGFESQTVKVNVTDGKLTNAGVISLKEGEVELTEIMIVADRAKERETPVAFSNIEKKEIEAQLGSRDIPMVMNTTPSVYATAGGGGSGDARINVRGFNQRNVAIMLNGVPVNDMENGWVYWSNWDGISDATSSIQMQRGLSAVNLATPSVGGTMNIITSPAEQKAGGVIKAEYGSGNFIKTSITGHSGMLMDKVAVSASVVRKIGNGVIDGTWTDAWAYYLGSTFKINKKHKLELFVLGAPQRHGQNLYKQNVAAYGHDIAKNFGADDSTLITYPEAKKEELYPDFADAKGGRYYNENWGPVSNTYTGQQAVGTSTFDRHSPDFLNERENFYHKPLVNLNWYAKWTEKIHQFTTVYYSGGSGGGSGTIGSMRWNYHAGITSPSRFVHWDKTIEKNMETDTAFGILRNSRNDQNTIGAISKFKIIFSDNFKMQAGIDWRKAQIEHYREVRDLLGGKFFVDNSNEYESGNEYNKVLGDKIAYHFTNNVDWIGYFVQGEYSNEMITAFGMFGNSFIKYNYLNHFKKAEGSEDKLTATTAFLPGYQIKGGLSYRAFDGFSVFVNLGYISKAPIFDNIIDDQSGIMADDPQNEIYNAYEGGINYTTPNRELDLKLNYYYTAWNNRAKNIGIYNQDGTEGYVYVSGMNQLHQGVEFEAIYRPLNWIEVGATASLAKWEYLNDVTGKYKTYDTGAEQEGEYTYYVKGLKVGDAPQTQIGASLTLKPVKGLRAQFTYKYNANHYADWSPFSRTDETDTKQVWETPAYQIMNAHISYTIPFKGKYSLQIFAHVFNLLDEIYIQDAVDNSRYNGFYGDDNRFSHTINSAEVYLGLPRTFNVGLKFSF